MNNILEKLAVNLTTSEIRCRFSEKPHDFEKRKRVKIICKRKNK